MEDDFLRGFNQVYNQTKDFVMDDIPRAYGQTKEFVMDDIPQAGRDTWAVLTGQKKELNAGAITGIVLGAAAGAILLALLIWGIVEGVRRSQEPRYGFVCSGTEGAACQFVSDCATVTSGKCYKTEEECVKAGCAEAPRYYVCLPNQETSEKMCFATYECTEEQLEEGNCFVTEKECKEECAAAQVPEVGYQCDGEGGECQLVDLEGCVQAAGEEEGESCHATLEECIAAGCSAPPKPEV